MSALLSSVPACSRIPSLQPAQHGVTYVVNRLCPAFTRWSSLLQVLFISVSIQGKGQE